VLQAALPIPMFELERWETFSKPTWSGPVISEAPKGSPASTPSTPLMSLARPQQPASLVDSWRVLRDDPRFKTLLEREKKLYDEAVNKYVF